MGRTGHQKDVQLNSVLSSDDGWLASCGAWPACITHARISFFWDGPHGFLLSFFAPYVPLGLVMSAPPMELRLACAVSSCEAGKPLPATNEKAMPRGAFAPQPPMHNSLSLIWQFRRWKLMGRQLS
jgi:hypothetical protein